MCFVHQTIIFKGKKRSTFSHLLMVRLGGVTPPPPNPPYGQLGHKILVFFTAPLNTTPCQKLILSYELVSFKRRFEAVDRNGSNNRKWQIWPLSDGFVGFCQSLRNVWRTLICPTPFGDWHPASKKSPQTLFCNSSSKGFHLLPQHVPDVLTAYLF